MNPTQTPEDIELQGTYNPLKVMQPGERVVCEIRRHPIGLLSLYSTLALVILVALAAVIAAPRVFTSMTSHSQAIVALGAVIICAFTGLFTYIGASVYKGNRWIVTTDSITQIAQVSLFNKQTSQLSMANLEDVTVEQNGMMQSMFGFGRLRAETAGERSKFTFEYCPRPTEFAKQIIAAHEAYIAEKPEEMHTTNRALTNTTSFNQSYGPNQQQFTSVQPLQTPPQPQAYNPAEPYQQQPASSGDTQPYSGNRPV